MNKHKQPAFWQRLTNFIDPGVGWWLIILMLCSISASFLLGCQSLTDNKNQAKKTSLQLKTVPITPQTSLKPASTTQLIFAGSGVNLEIIRLLAKQFQKTHPKVKINVPASIGSSGAIQAVVDGQIAVGAISRLLTEQEKQLGLTVIPYAQTPLALAVHPSVADNNITSTQLLDIYQGKKSQWLDGKEIIVLTREPQDSSTLILKQNISGFNQVYTDSQKHQRWITLYKDQEMNSYLAKTPSALGLADIGTITAEKKLSSLKILKFNGIAPTIANIRNGKYPLVKTLYFVFERNKISPHAQEFINFVKSSQGKEVLKANSYLAVGEENKK